MPRTSYVPSNVQLNHRLFRALSYAKVCKLDLPHTFPRPTETRLGKYVPTYLGSTRYPLTPFGRYLHPPSLKNEGITNPFI